MNLADSISTHASAHPGHPALIQGKVTVSYAQLDEMVSRAASLLVSLKVVPGDLVGVCLEDRIEHVVALYAVARSGASILPMDVRWTTDERIRITEFFGAKVLLHEPNQSLTSVGSSIVVDDRWLEKVEEHSASDTFPRVDNDSHLILSLSTGTTGVPKGPMLTHQQMKARFVTQAKSLGFCSNDRYLSATPIYFGAGRGFVMGMIHNGATVVLLPPPYELDEFLNAVEYYAIDVTLLVPTTLRRLLAIAKSDQLLLGRLRLLLSTGAILHADERTAVMNSLSPYLLNYYGSTEGGGISVLRWDDPAEKSESVGRPVFGSEIEVVDELDNPVSPNGVGRIRYRGPSVADGFFRDSNASETAFEAGWFYPGDFGYFDKDGFLYLTGRIKDVIIRGGINIYPKEIEEILLTHPDVADAAVAGWPSKSRGEEVAAFVVCRSDRQLTKQALIIFCQGKIAPYKVPSEVFFLEDLPKNSVGKVRKSELVPKFSSYNP